ncbi:MAG: hypothetical protein IMW96_05600 [Thermoanaerobacteraceae bacterium]|nr:hypothetical protein [Thermoanaerobacteraceae bacterium]
MRPQNSQPTIGHLIEVPAVRTVIQLQDARDPDLQEHLVQSFVLTGEAERALGAVLSAIARDEGQGFFLLGPYGSGKSHLLAVLHLLLTSPEKREVMAAKERVAAAWPEGWQALLERVGGRRYLVAAVSLVEHSHHEELEDIVLAALDEAAQANFGRALGLATREQYVAQARAILTARYPEVLEEFLAQRGTTEEELFAPANIHLLQALLRQVGMPFRWGYRRQEVMAELESLLDGGAAGGAVILIDELSEFLRSKPDSRSFNEDIRFLQYLGEISRRMPLWVVATLQEQIEATGDIPPEAFNKIKDRYPVCFRLTGEHLREIISRRLIVHRPPAREYLAELYGELKGAFHELPFSQEEFYDLYPVHPLTVAFLERLRPLFSQHRGVVDFIYSRLTGDPARQIPGLLDRPADTLLGPDLIFDHFQDRIRALPETNPYVQQVFNYYQEEMPRLLPEPREQELGFRLLKVLILAALGASAKPLTVRDLTHLLLCPLTRLEWHLNYEYIADILQRLYRGGAYIGCHEGSSPLDTAFYVDLQADVQLLVRRRVEYLKKGFFPGDRRIFTTLGRHLTDARLPLASLLAETRTPLEVSWQQTRREGLILLKDLEDLSPESVQELARESLTTDVDFILVLGWAGDTERQHRHLEERLLPALTGPAGRAFLFWLPSDLSEEEEFLTQALAYELLREEYAGDASPTGQRVRAYLDGIWEEVKGRVQDIFRRAYLSGRLIDGEGEEVPWPTNPAYESFKGLVERLAAVVLGRRYPRHAKVAPRGGVILPPLLQRVINELLIPGELKGKPDANLKMGLENFFHPLGVVKKTREGYFLEISPEKNPLVAACLEHLKEGPAELETLSWKLRKSPFGLSETGFQLLVLALVGSGLVVPYASGRRLNLRQIGPYNFQKIDKLALAETLPASFQEILAGVKFLPPAWRQGTFTPARQQEIWDYLVRFRREAGTHLQRVEHLLESVADYPALAALPWETARADLRRVAALLEEIKVSYGPREGLERFLTAYQADPLWELAWERTQKLGAFLEQHLNHFLFMYGYLTAPQLSLPDSPAYQGLREARDKLLGLLQTPDLFYQEDLYQQAASAFARFQRDYIEQYTAEHRRLRSPERFQPYHALREGEAYQLLSLLSQLKQVAAPDSLRRINQLLVTALARQCAENPEEKLALQPACPCGLVLGVKDELPSTAAIQAAIEQGLRDYLQALKEPLYREKVQGFLAGLEKVGRAQEAARVRRLLDLDLDSPGLLTRLKSVLNRAAVDLINQALAGQVLVLDRNLDDLYDLLVNRIFRPDQLLDVVRRWMTGPDKEEVEPGAHIRVIGSGVKGTADGLVEKKAFYSHSPGNVYTWLAETYPELVPYWNQWGGSRFLLVLTTIWWLKIHGRDARMVARLCSLPEVPPAALSSLLELARQVFELQAGPEEVIPAAVMAARESLDGQAEEAYWQVLAPREDIPGPDLLPVLARENIFPVLLRRATVRYLEWLEGADGPELAAAVARLDAVSAAPPGPAWEGSEPAAWLDACRLATRLVYSLKALGAADPEGFKGPDWEKVYSSHLGTLESLYAHLEQRLSLLGLAGDFPLTQVEGEVRRLLAGYADAFRRFYGERSSAPGLTLEELLSRLERYRQRWRPEALYFIWADGLRWDACEVMVAELGRSGVLYEEVARGLLWCPVPTVTATQLARLEGAGKALRFLEIGLPPGDPAEVARQGNRLAPGDPKPVLRLNLVDEKVHTSTADYATFLAELALGFRRQLLPLVSAFPARSLILIAGDHGYAVNHGFRPEDEEHSPRYLHGGVSPQEVLVPWVILWKVGNRPSASGQLDFEPFYGGGTGGGDRRAAGRFSL